MYISESEIFPGREKRMEPVVLYYMPKYACGNMSLRAEVCADENEAMSVVLQTAATYWEISVSGKILAASFKES